MPRIISMHEYVLRPTRSEKDFISAVLAAKHEGMWISLASFITDSSMV